MAGSDVLVVAELREGLASPLTRELLGLARELAADGNHPHPNPPPEGEGFENEPAPMGGNEGKEVTEGNHGFPLWRSPPEGPAGALRGKAGMGVVALLIGKSRDAASDLIAHGADRVYLCDDLESDEYDGELWVPIAKHVAREIASLAILAGHTPAGADLAPRLAFRLGSGVAMGCVAVALESGRLLFTRPCYGGNVRETLSFTAAPAIATVKAGVGSATVDAARHGDIVRVSAPAIQPRTRIVARERETADSKSLEDAKIIVAGGRGLEGPEGFRVLEALAEVLGAAVGASRVPCDLGWCPHSWQIGLTGKTVTPDLYFAVGISGAGHHMAGCGNARTIVAINTDPQAAIFRDARFGVVGDYRRIVPALVEALNRQERREIQFEPPRRQDAKDS